MYKALYKGNFRDYEGNLIEVTLSKKFKFEVTPLSAKAEYNTEYVTFKVRIADTGEIGSVNVWAEGIYDHISTTTTDDALTVKVFLRENGESTPRLIRVFFEYEDVTLTSDITQKGKVLDSDVYFYLPTEWLEIFRQYGEHIPSEMNVHITGTIDGEPFDKYVYAGFGNSVRLGDVRIKSSMGDSHTITVTTLSLMSYTNAISNFRLTNMVGVGYDSTYPTQTPMAYDESTFWEGYPINFDYNTPQTFEVSNMSDGYDTNIVVFPVQYGVMSLNLEEDSEEVTTIEE